MNAAVQTLAERSREVAARFLQTVIVIDDEARFQSAMASESGANVGTTDAPSGDAVSEGPNSSSGVKDSPLALKTPSRTQLQAAAEDQGDSHDLDAKEVTDGFARHGLVCGVLRPNVGEAATLGQTLAVGRADIVVLDWVFHNDYGSITLELISTLLRSDSERLRLIAIYTGQNDLKRIADRIAELMQAYFEGHPLQRPNPFTVERGPVRIAVFAKPNTRIPEVDAEANARIISSAELPLVLIDEFASMTSGLVSHVTLASLAALRRNSHRVLRRLSPSLDAAYLWHRATQVHPQDAEFHLKSIIIEELAAVLGDENIEAYANIDAIASWLKVWVPEDDYKTRFGLQASPDRQDAIELLTKGVIGKDNDSIRQKFSTLGRKAHSRSDQCFAGSPTACTTANESFAMLLSLRSHYQPPTPILGLGSVLRLGAGGDRTYWVCVQPSCDSLRLKEKTAFPLLPLSVVPPGELFHIVVRQTESTTVRLKLLSKPMNVRMENFLPTDAIRGVVGAAGDELGWYFVTDDSERFYWVADMKPEHGLWIANQLSGQLRRVGLIESEWLRRWYSTSDE
jgi:Response receiver domain